MYLNSIQIIGFLGKDPERRQAPGNGVEYTVLSVATQRSWKNAQEEWQSKTDWHRVVLWSSRSVLAERLHAGDHVLVGGTLVSSTYEREIGNRKKASTLKLTSWSISANIIRKLNRAEKKAEAVSTSSGDLSAAATIESSTDAPFLGSVRSSYKFALRPQKGPGIPTLTFRPYCDNYPTMTKPTSSTETELASGWPLTGVETCLNAGKKDLLVSLIQRRYEERFLNQFAPSGQQAVTLRAMGSRSWPCAPCSLRACSPTATAYPQHMKGSMPLWPPLILQLNTISLRQSENLGHRYLWTFSLFLHTKSSSPVSMEEPITLGFEMASFTKHKRRADGKSE